MNAIIAQCGGPTPVINATVAAVIVAWSEMSRPQPPLPACPTLVVLGARSWLPVKVDAAANVQTVTVPGGHSVLWDDFDETATAVASFLA